MKNAMQLKTALVATAEKRGTASVIENYAEVISMVKDSNVMKQRWDIYRDDFAYATDIDFDEVCDAVITIMDGISMQVEAFENEEDATRFATELAVLPCQP